MTLRAFPVLAVAGLLAMASANPIKKGSLDDLAMRKGRYFGDAVTSWYVKGQYKDILESQFNSITPENEASQAELEKMKWEVIEPQRGVFNWTGGDLIIKEAKKTQSLVRGHNFVWHQQTPEWVTSITDAEELKTVLKEHIDAVMGRYAKDLYAFDVINEPLFENGTFRDSVWYNVLGEDYLGIALDYAHAAAPNVKLYINDYNIESVNDKSKAYASIAKKLLDQGKPLHGIGFESHFVGNQVPKDISQSMNQFTDMGLDVAITELDVRVPIKCDGTASEAQLEQQAKDYAFVVRACLNNNRCPGITVWSFVDSVSWIPEVFPGEGAADLYDLNFQPKPAYYAVQQALE